MGAMSESTKEDKNKQLLSEEQINVRIERERAFHTYVERGIDEALLLIRERFENTPEKAEQLAFHASSHTEGLIQRTRDILYAIADADPSLITSHEIEIGRLAAAYHDIVQRFKEERIQEGAFTKVMRKRATALNEAESAWAALGFMDRANIESGIPDLFNEEDKRMAWEAIEDTVSEFSAEKKTVVQPNLTDRSSLVARAVALADLGSAGIGGPKTFLYEGDALFREENLDILESLERPEKIIPEIKEYYRGRMLAWSKFQPFFAAGRKQSLEEELRAIPESARAQVAKLFSHFDESIAAAEKRALRREHMSYEEFVADMGY